MVRMVRLLPVAAEQLNSSLCPCWGGHSPQGTGAHPTRHLGCLTSRVSGDSTRATLLGCLCTRGTWSTSAPKAFGISLPLESLGAPSYANPLGVSLHPESHKTSITAPLEHFCTQNFWAPGPLGHLSPKSLGVSHTLKCFTPRTCGVSLYSEPLEHLTPQNFWGISCPGLCSIGPPGRVAGNAHTRGP